MPFVSENKPGPLDDLISFEDDSRDGSNSLSEIQKLFDPLFQNRTPNVKNAVTMRTITNKCPYPPPLPAKPHVPWLLLHKGNHPLDAKCASISPAPHVNDENEDIASFLSIFISPNEKDALKCSVANTPYGFAGNTSLSNAETDSVVSPTDSIRCTTACTPAVLRRRDEEKHRDCAFLPNTYTSVEIERFVETVESMNTDHVRTPTYSVQNETPPFDFDGSVGKHEKNINHYLGSFSHDNWVYNSVFGNVLAQDVLNHTSTCQNGSIPSETDRLEGQIPVRWWRTKTGASKVAEITPLAPRPSEVDGEAPMHWRNTPRWNIPQIEVRITGHWIIRRPRSGLTQSGGPEDCAQSAPDGTGSKSLSTDSQRTHSMPRLRLVSDPNSTFVCELMMEALSNIALPAGASMNANDYQLRIHGRAELLNPQARLCDCDQVQLCHRLDLPLRLILEPKRYGNSDTEQTEHATQTRGPFMPYSCSINPLRVSPDGEMSISYGVFRNALEKVRATIIRNREKIEASKWLSEVQCARSTLVQSVKAVLAAVCQSVAFTDVLDALCHAQVCIMDAIQDAGLSGGTQGGKTLPTEHWLNSVRCKQTKLADVTLLKYFTQPKPNTNTNQMASNTLVTEQTRKKLEHALRRLEANLLAQIHVFLDWRQIGLRVNPLSMTCWPKAQDAVPIGRRPRGLLFESDSAEASAIKEMVLTSKCKETRSSADCVDPFVVGLIAVHRAPRFSSGTPGASSASLPRSRSTSPTKMGSGSPSTDGNATIKNNMDSRFYVRLSLTYAGHPLGRIWPQDLSSYSMETNSHSSLSRSSQSTRDTFYSDAGRTQTIISGFPKVLQFDQWFKFPGFSINCLPRETMLSVSLFSYKKGCPEQTEVDRTLVGWVNIPIFQANGLLKQNTIVAGLWSPNSGPMLEYRPTWTQSNRSSTCPLIQLVFPEYPFEIEYPKIDALRSSTKCFPSYRFSDLPSEAKQAVTEAECAVFLQTLDPELSANSDVLCWTSYSAAASASSRAARQGKTYPVLPDLHLSALTSCTSAGSSGFVTSPTGSVAPLVSAAATTGINDDSASFATAPSPVAIEVLWNVRPWLTDMPSGLVALLIGVLITWPQEAQGDSFSRNAVWTWTRLLQDIYNLLKRSRPPCPGLALRLLAPDVVDQGIRHWAVRSLALLPSDVLLYHLPQIVEAINHDLYMDYSGLASLLLFRAVTSVRFAHALYWQVNLVTQDAATTGPGTSVLAASVSSPTLDSTSLTSLSAASTPAVNYTSQSTHWNATANGDSNDWRIQRFLMLKSALLWLATPQLRSAWTRQEEVIDRLHRAAIAIKHCKVSSNAREEALHSHLRALMHFLNEDYQRASAAVAEHRNTETANQKTADRVQPVKRSVPTPLLIQWDDDNTSAPETNEQSTPSTDSNPDKALSTSSQIDEVTTTITLIPGQPALFYDVGFRIPYNPGLLTHRIDLHACTYFTSFTCPLRLVFHSLETGADPIMVMFKAGDDLRLDSLITQITFIMDRIWLNAGLDLRTIHFRIVPTGDRKGLIELVSECSTLRQIQQQGGGLTGPFKDSVITTWIQSQNTTELDYKRALDNFLRSLAGCCVMTYVLGVGDRHNDNIMIRYSGHVFHVDFAKVFGNAQTFAGFKRDRVPFVLTQDMLHVLQAYSREILSEASGTSTGFGSSSSSSTGRNSNREGVQLFIDYCCEAYNLIRKHSYSLLSILEMGLTMDIPGVTRESVRYVMRALKLNLSDQQASQHFTELIRKSLQSKLTALNFFVHGLAQVKQASSGGGVSGTGSGSPSIQPNSPRGSMSRVDNHENDMLPDTLSSGVAAGTNRAATLNNNTGQLLSFNPKRFSYTQDGHIDAVVVEAAVKKKSNDKHLVSRPRSHPVRWSRYSKPSQDHYFPMYVWRKHCRVPTRVYRRIADLNELGLAVQEAYPNSPVLAILPHLLNALNSGSVSSVKTQNNVQTLVDTLLEEDDSVSKSDLVYTFFHSVLFDERFSAEDAAHLSVNSSQVAFWAPTQMPCELAMSGERGRSNLATPLLTPSVATVGATVDPRDFGSAAAVQRASESLPALQLELCLSENQQELNLLIKHGRALLIPGSNELPDVYVKVYLLSGRRRKSTKRKTAIIRRSSAPSFNTTFTYELTTHDVQVGFLEISAWHAVNLGENFSLGQVYIQLRSLTPGRSITKWYPLNSDWDAV